MAHLAKYGEVRRGRIGLRAQDPTPEIAQALGLTPNQGALVVDIAPDWSSAELIAALTVPGRVVLSVARGKYVFGLMLRK